jgi:hypothetical protein
MDDLEVIRTLRNILGEEDDDGFYLPVGTTMVPNFVETDHKAESPEIIMRPFISNITMDEIELYCGEGANTTRSRVKLNHARFQFDIYSKTRIELLKIQKELMNRIDDFMHPEALVFSDNTGWDEIDDTGVYLNEYYDSDYPIYKLQEPLATLTQCTALEDVTTTPGSWYLDDTGLYVNPVNEIIDIEIYYLLNGRILPTNQTAHEKGIQSMKLLLSREIKDSEPNIERWSLDYMVSYRASRRINIGEKLEEIDLDVQKE